MGKRKFIVETPLKQLPGIYKITCEDTDKIYIGESVNISQRIQKHFSLLRHNKHSNPILQNIFNKHGEEKFHVEVIKYTNFTDELELKKLEQKYQKECSNCISLDSNEIFVVERSEEWCKKQGELLNSYREQMLDELVRKPIIIYDVIDKKTIEFKQMKDAESIMEHKHMHKNVNEKILVPYKHRYVAFYKEEYSPDLIKKIITVYNTENIKTSNFTQSCDLYNLLTKEEKHFGSKLQFSLEFSKSKNDKLYDYYLDNNILDFEFRCVKNPKNKEEFLNLVLSLSPRFNKTTQRTVKEWYNALLECDTKQAISDKTNISRHTITTLLNKHRNKIDWIRLIEKVLNQLPD